MPGTAPVATPVRPHPVLPLALRVLRLRLGAGGAASARGPGGRVHGAAARRNWRPRMAVAPGRPAPARPRRRCGAVETIYLGGGTPTVLPADLLLPFVARAGGPAGGCGRSGVHRRGQPRHHRRGAARAAGRSRRHARLPGGAVVRAGAARGAGPAHRRRRRSRPRCATWPRPPRAAARSGSGTSTWCSAYPGQTWADAAADIDAAVAAGPTHISLYDLTYTPAYAARVARTCRRRRPRGGRRLRRGAPARPPPPAWRRPATGATRSPTSRCPATNAGTTWPTGAGEDYLGVGASAVSTIGGERRTNPRVGGRLPGRRSAGDRGPGRAHAPVGEGHAGPADGRGSGRGGGAAGARSGRSGAARRRRAACTGAVVDFA